MLNRTSVLALALLAAGTLPASAQTSGAPGRFVMQPIEGGFLRLDTQTGAVSTCRAGGGNVVLCQPAQEEQQALAKENERLRSENAALKDQIKQLQTAAGPGVPPPAVVEPPGKEKFQLPSEEDVDSALDYLERMFKKFRDRLRNLEEDSKQTGKPL